MKPSDDLFLLIKNMTMSEKRHFKIYASRHMIGRTNNYLLLYDVIDKQKTYDEKEVKQKLAGKKFINHLGPEKSYLYNLILDSLHVYHMNIQKDGMLRKQLHQANLLFEKGLYEQSESLLEKVKTAALELDKYQYVHEALLLQRRSYGKQLFNGISPESLEKSIEEGKVALERLINQEDYLNIQLRLLIHGAQTGIARTNEQKKLYDRIVSGKLMRNPEAALTRKSELLFNYIQIQYLLNIQEHPHKILPIAQKNIDLFEQHPVLLTDDPGLYTISMYSLIRVCILLKDYKKAQALIEELRSIDNRYKIKINNHLAAQLFLQTYIYEMYIVSIQHRFNEAERLMERISEGLEQHAGKMDNNNLGILYYNLAGLFIYAGNYKKGLHWINIFLNHVSADARQDVVCVCKIILLILYYEMNDLYYLPYIFKSTYRFLRKKERIYKSESIILDLIRQLPSASSNEKLLAAFKRAHDRLVEASSTPLEKRFISQFDFIGWLESKLKGIPFSKFMAERTF